MNEIHDKLDFIISELKQLRQEVNQIKESNNKMDKHVDFVENVFDTVKYPFFGLMNFIGNSLTYETKTLKNSECKDE